MTLKRGDIVRDWWAGTLNPQRCFIVIGLGPTIKGLDREFNVIECQRQDYLEVIGSIDLSPLDRALEEHANREYRTRGMKT